MLTFHSFRGSGSTYSRLHHRLPKSFNADAISSLHFLKSIREGNLYFGPLEVTLSSLIVLGWVNFVFVRFWTLKEQGTLLWLLGVKNKLWTFFFFFKRIFGRKTNIVFATLFEPPHDKTNNVAVRPAKTQISLGIRPVWSESSLSAWRKVGSLATHWTHSESSDQTGRMLRLIWVFVGRIATLFVLSWDGSFPSNQVNTVMFLSFRTGRSGQTVQTQIRLLLKEQSDQGLHCLPFRLHRLDSLLYGRAT